MKSILLASASIVGLTIAGAAQAEVTFTGSASLSYNDTDNYAITNVDTGDDVGSDDGFSWDANIAVTLSQMLDNGLTASVTFDFDAADGDLGSDLEAGGFLLSLTSDMGGLYFGDTDFAAQTYWNGVSGMEADSFSEADGETVLRTETMFGPVTAGFSYIYDNQGWEDYDPDLSTVGDALVTRPGTDDLVQLSFGATAEFGNFSTSFGYQEGINDLAYLGLQTDEDGVTTIASFNGNGDINAATVYGVSVSTTFAGADVTLAWAQQDYDQDFGWTSPDQRSLGLGVSYAFGPVVVDAAYATNSEDTDNYEIGMTYTNGPVMVMASYEDTTDNDDFAFSLDGSYDVGSGLKVLAGLSDSETNSEIDYYVASEVDLGSGAMFTASYAVDDDFSEEDEIGDPEFEEGLTLGFSFEF